MRVLGIDPGYERLGIAVLEKSHSAKASRDKEQVIFSECFKTSAKLEFPERLFLIGEEVKNIIKKYKPEVLSIETLFLTTNQKTVMQVAEVRGVVIYEAVCAGLKIFEASPPQIKIATTGYGKANKEQVMKMVRLLVEIDPVRGRELNRTGDSIQQQPSASNGTDDELDAIAIALTAFACLRV